MSLPKRSHEVSNVTAVNYMLYWATQKTAISFAQSTLNDTSQWSLGDKQHYLFIHYISLNRV